MTGITVITGDITLQDTEAIVNAANGSLSGGGGVDGAIHRAAGNRLVEECRALGGCKTGEAKITGGYALPCSYVIHTVGPVWHGGERDEDKLLAMCYTNSLNLAFRHGIKSIAFPAISTGAYRFPKERAARIAVNSVKEFSNGGGKIEEVVFVCHNEETFGIYYDALRYCSPKQ